MPRFQVVMIPFGSSMKIAYRLTPSTSIRYLSSLSTKAATTLRYEGFGVARSVMPGSDSARKTVVRRRTYSPNTFLTSPIFRWTLPLTFSAVPRSRRFGSLAVFPTSSFVDSAFYPVLCARFHTNDSRFSRLTAGTI